MNLSDRQIEIIDIVKEKGLITANEIAEKLGLSRATIRSDLSILTMMKLLSARPRVGYFYTGKTEITLLTDKIKQIKVRDVMSLPFVVDESSSIYDSIVSMFLEDIGSVYVTSDGFLSGVVSRKDMLRATLGRDDLSKIPLSVIMTRMPNIIYIEADSSVLEATKKIVECGVDGLPVVEKKEQGLIVIGRFTKTNVVRLFDEIFKGE